MVTSCFWRARLGALVCLCILAGSVRGAAQQFAQYYSVDCSNPSAQFPTISSALAAATDGTSIYVPPGNTCTENVTISYLKNVAIVTDWMQTFNLVGNLSIQSSHTAEIQGMVVTNSSGDGIDVNNSTDVTLTFVQSVNNAREGLALTSSQVTIAGAGSFKNNGNIGIDAGLNSTLSISAWGGIVDISNDTIFGINLDRSIMSIFGNITINDTKAVPGDGGFGINEYGGAKAGMFAGFGPISISSNANGGVSLQETSEMSMGGNISWAPYLVNIQGNGPLGVALDYGASLTLIGGVTIADHTTAGVSLYGNSQATFLNSNQIVHNGTGTDGRRAGIEVAQGSQANVGGASIKDNGGPGILGLTHATLDVEGSTFTSNAGGAIVCDASTVLETDLPHSVLGSANACSISAPGGQPPHGSDKLGLSLPDWQRVKARSIKLNSMIVLHHLNTTPLAK